MISWLGKKSRSSFDHYVAKNSDIIVVGYCIAIGMVFYYFINDENISLMEDDLY